jgi:glucokinase
MHEQMGLNNQHPLALGLDVGGTKLAGVLMAEDGEIIAREARHTYGYEGGEAVLQRLIELAEKMFSMSAGWPVAGIGVATPGIVDLEGGSVRFVSTELPGWSKLPLAEAISRRFGLPVLIENDGRAAALAEHRLGAGSSCRNFLTIVLGTGVGGGIVANGEILRGEHGGGGRLGHISVDPDGPPCTCGNRGCLELFASGPALARAMLTAIHAGRPSLLAGEIRAKPAQRLSGRQVVEAAKAGDDLAKSVVENAGRMLGLAIVQMARILDPVKIVVGGSISTAGDLLLDPAREVLSRSSPQGYSLTQEIVRAKFGRDASVIGAGLLGLEAAAPVRMKKVDGLESAGGAE